jgi:hypothetical protein
MFLGRHVRNTDGNVHNCYALDAQIRAIPEPRASEMMVGMNATRFRGATFHEPLAGKIRLILGCVLARPPMVWAAE